MQKFAIIIALLSFLVGGCATHNTLKSFSDVYDSPIKEVISYKIVENVFYSFCIVGELKKEGIGEYQIDINKTRIQNSGFRCRNNSVEKINDRYYCTEYTIAVINIKKEDIKCGCFSFENDENPVYTVAIPTNDGRTLLVKDSKDLDIIEINIGEVWEDTNPIAYIFLPVTLAFDVVTSPFQLGAALGR